MMQVAPRAAAGAHFTKGDRHVPRPDRRPL